MATPDYLQQVILSNKRRAAVGHRRYASSFRFFQRPSVTSIIWAGVDLLTAGLACVLATHFRARVTIALDHGSSIPLLIRATTTVPVSTVLACYVGVFAAYLIFFTRSYGLYGPIQHRSGLNEQRLTVQATLTAGLLLCWTLYVLRGEMVSRVVVLLLVIFTGMLLCVRRAL